MLTRRLPIYLIVDTSKSMAGAPIDAVKDAVRVLIEKLKTDPKAIEATFISMITFDCAAKQMIPLIELLAINMEEVSVMIDQNMDDGCRNDPGETTCMGAALELLMDCYKNEIILPLYPVGRGDYKPVVLLFTDGYATDNWHSVADGIRAAVRGNKMLWRFVALGAGDTDLTALKRVTDDVSFLHERILDIYLSCSSNPQLVEQELIEQEAFLDESSEAGGSAELPAPPPNIEIVCKESLDLWSDSLPALHPRRLPVYLIIDTSGTMDSDALEALSHGVKSFVADITDPITMEVVSLSIITYGGMATQLVPLTEIMTFNVPAFEAHGSTCLGEALKLLLECYKREIITNTSATQKGDYKPYVFLWSHSQPTDGWEKVVDEIGGKGRINEIFPRFVAIAMGNDADIGALKQLTDNVLLLHELRPDTFKSYFKWNS